MESAPVLPNTATVPNSRSPLTSPLVAIARTDKASFSVVEPSGISMAIFA